MAKHGSYLLILLVISSSYLIQNCDGFEMGIGVLDIIKLAKYVLEGIGKAWGIVDQSVNFSTIPIPILDRTEAKLFGKINAISQKMDELAGRIDGVGTNTIAMVLHNLPDRVRLELRLNDLLNYMTRADVNFKSFQRYADNQNDFERLTLEDFARMVVSHDSNSVVNLMERIHAFVAPSGRGLADTGLLELLIKDLKIIPKSFLCQFLNSKFLLGIKTTYIDSPRAGDWFWAFPKDLTYGLETLESVWTLQLALSDLRAIYGLYETFRRFENQQTAPHRIPSPKQAWLNLANTILYDKNNVDESMTRIQLNIDKDKLFESAKKEVEGDMICNSKQSPQQVLYNLYNAIALTELKGYSMIQFSYMLLRLYNKGNFTTESSIMRQRFEERTNSAIEIVKKAMTDASRQYWNCDPKKHIKGETYEEITQLLQGYIQNEVDLNPEGTCSENCAEYTYTKSHGCFKNLYCRQQRRCFGKILDCRYFDSDMWICPADPLSSRRYEYVEYENGRVLGRKQNCNRGSTKVDSWWRWLFWHCSYCFCLCDEQGPTSDRYVNMRAVIANLSDNMVVTGLRFVKKNRIIHVQIQEGRLLPRGNIDATTMRWVPVEDYKITDRKIYNGQDYHTFSWEKRAVDLDDLEADEGYVLTGVRFKEIGSHLNFEIYVTKFDFDTGKLINPSSTSIWKDNSNTDSANKNPRKKIWLTNPDIPTRTTAPSLPTSKSDQYIELINSDIDRDAAQTTVPFLDAQKLESLQPVPLSGAGIFHKGQKFFGGFITLKTITYDFSRHMQAAFPEGEVN